MGSLLASLLYHDANGCATEAKGLSDAVFEIPLVGEVEQLRIVTEEYEGGGCHRALGHIVDLKALSLVGGGLYLFHGAVQQLVEYHDIFYVYSKSTFFFFLDRNQCRR